MSSEPAERPRPSPPSPRPASGADKAKAKAEAKKAQVTDELRAMMRDVPVSERLMRTLDDLEALAEQDETGPASEGPDPQEDR